MAIVKSSNEVTVNKTYTEKVVERTSAVSIFINAGQPPRINITREIVIYHDDVVVSSAAVKNFDITVEDLQAIGKVGIIEEIANTIDLIAESK